MFAVFCGSGGLGFVLSFLIFSSFLFTREVPVVLYNFGMLGFGDLRGLGVLSRVVREIGSF